MFKRIKEVFLILFCVLALASPGFAVEATDTVTIAFFSAFSLTKEQDISVNITPQEGKSSYTDSDFFSSSPGKLLANGDAGASVAITCPDSVTLTHTNGSDTAILNLACRADTSSYVADKSSGTACDDANLQTDSTTGKLYISIFPDSVDVTSATAYGIYSGTITVTIDYVQ